MPRVAYSDQTCTDVEILLHPPDVVWVSSLFIYLIKKSVKTRLSLKHLPAIYEYATFSIVLHASFFPVLSIGDMELLK